MAHSFRFGKLSEIIEPFETCRVAKDGSRKTVSLTISPAVNDNGIVVGASAIARDITELKRNALRLATEHAISRIMSDASSFTTASKSLLETITRGVECDIGEIWIPDEPRNVLTRLKSVTLDPIAKVVEFERESAEYEFSVGHGLPGRVWESGCPTWITDISTDGNVPRVVIAQAAGLSSGMAFPIHSGLKLLGVMAFFTRRRVEPDAALLNMMKALGNDIGLYLRHMKIDADNANLAAIIECSSDAIFSWAKNGIITSWNPQAQRIFGHLADDIIGKSVLEIVPEILQEKAKRLIDYLVRSQRGGRFHNCAIQNGGQEILLSLTIEPVMDHTGVLTGFSTIARDVTMQRNAEDSLRSAKEQAEQANKAKSQFLATMSHEIRSPLHGMLATADLLLYSNLTPDQKEYAEILRDSEEQLNYLLNDLLDLSKIETGHLKLRLQKFDLRNLLDNMTTVWETRAASKGIDCFVSIQPDLPFLFRGDECRIRQVLENFVSNALKYTEEGYIAVKVSAKNTDNDTTTLRMEVKDTGVGIKPHTQSRLFKRFERGELKPKNTEGNGLGLAICKELVDLMGGQIGVDSVSGRGSTFWFTVPVKQLRTRSGERSRNLSHAHVAVPVVPTAGLKILVADDSETNLKILTDILSLAGHSVEVVMDRLQAVEAVRRTQYDLIFMDIRMPKLDGVAAARKIRLLDKNRNTVPIVAVTANAMQGDREQYLENGLTDYIAKPFHLTDVLAVVNRLAGSTSKASLPN